MRLDSSTSHFSHWPIHSLAASTASANFRSRRMSGRVSWFRESAIGSQQSGVGSREKGQQISSVSSEARLPSPLRRAALALQLGSEVLVHGRLRERKPLRLLGAELGPRLVDRLELGVLGRLLLVERGGR